MHDKIIIRRAHAADAEALDRLAQLDSSRVPEGDLMVALVDGDLRAAVPESGGRPIADPFHYTDELIDAIKACAGDDRASIRLRRRPILAALRLA
jgi:hypothetical protein